MTRARRRYPEIDLLRTVAIVGMVVYHTGLLGWYGFGWQIDPLAGAWWLLARVTAHSFLLAVGLSFVVASIRQRGRAAVWRRAARRGLTVLAGALFVTLASRAAVPDAWVRFGILHCIGVTMLLLPLVHRLGGWNVIVGAVVAAAGWQILAEPTSSALLLPFGLVPPGLSTLDYYPLLPWAGVAVIGAGLGSLLYETAGLAPLLTGERWRRWTWPGRHALAIYLVHPWVIYAVLASL